MTPEKPREKFLHCLVCVRLRRNMLEKRSTINQILTWGRDQFHEQKTCILVQKQKNSIKYHHDT